MSNESNHNDRSPRRGAEGEHNDNEELSTTSEDGPDPGLCTMPPHFFQVVCQLLIDRRHHECRHLTHIDSGLTDVLNLRTTCRQLNRKVKRSIIDFHLAIPSSPDRMPATLRAVNLIEHNFDWKLVSLYIQAGKPEGFDMRNREDIKNYWKSLENCLLEVANKTLIFTKKLKNVKLNVDSLRQYE